jgi:hypothetical protein
MVGCSECSKLLPTNRFKKRTKFTPLCPAVCMDCTEKLKKDVLRQVVDMRIEDGYKILSLGRHTINKGIVTEGYKVNTDLCFIMNNVYGRHT